MPDLAGLRVKDAATMAWQKWVTGGHRTTLSVRLLYPQIAAEVVAVPKFSARARNGREQLQKLR
jgi:hypothetical protein